MFSKIIPLTLTAALLCSPFDSLALNGNCMAQDVTTDDVQISKGELRNLYLQMTEAQICSESNAPIDSSFDRFNNVSEDDLQLTILNELDNNSCTSAIVRNETGGELFYYCMDYDEDTFEFAIDGEFYTVTEDAGSAYLIDENGASILIGELEENRGKLILDNPSAAASSSWVLVSSNNHKTIILYQKFLYLISTVYNMGKVYYKYKTEGSMGTINILMATAAAIGQWCSVTAYVIYTQYYRSDCTAYYHEYGDIYTADGSSYMDHYDTYFHSVRPDYAELLSL